MKHSCLVTGWVLVFALLGACVQVEPRAEFEKAGDLVKTSTGQSEVFDPAEPTLTEEQLSAILDDGLTLAEALHLALVNNRELQADYQEIGVAHADWVQSQLLSNPSLDVLARSPAGGGRSMFEAVIGVELLELWRIPMRKEYAQQNLEATVLRIARRAGVVLAEARGAYYRAVAAEELLHVAQENVELATMSLGAVTSLHAAGAADAFDESLARGPLLAAQLAFRTTRIEAANAKRELCRHLSLNRPGSGIVLLERWPEPHTEQVEPEGLVQQALEARLDLRAIAMGIKALDAHVDLEQRGAWGSVTAGANVERPAVSGQATSGPAVSLTLPIFDQNRARVARAGFKREQLVKLYEAAQVTVAQNVRASADRVNSAARNMAFYSEELLPQAQRSLELARESYAAGRTTLLALVEVQRQLLDARRGLVALQLEAAVSMSELERAVGRTLAGTH
ncbi:MAG: TolC family protein [Planctomycetota bacterium]|nr:TolC family protein [Planctomycetota bacterium]MDP6838967.1 TolC family protein [Planctomycetota bacterium]MDP6957109.1 TolC family protein [Planctomycetota bacterium]